MLSLGRDQVVRCTYHLEVFQNFEILEAGAEMQGAVSVAGFVDIVMRGEIPESATLTLAGGDQLHLTIHKASAWQSVRPNTWTLRVSATEGKRSVA